MAWKAFAPAFNSNFDDLPRDAQKAAFAHMDEGGAVEKLIKQVGHPDPLNTKGFSLKGHEATASAIEKSVAAQHQKNPYQRKNMTDLVKEFKDVPLDTLKKIVGKMQHEGRVRLGAFTQALATHPNPEHLFPLDREAKFYLEPVGR